MMNGMSLGVNVIWCGTQFTGDLQFIVAKYRHYFDGGSVPTADIESEYEDDT